MAEIKQYIDYLETERIDSVSGLELLKKDTNLSPSEKNLIYAYCYPRALQDRELPSRVQEYRNSKGILSGWLTPEIGEITLLLEACKTEQYGRFMKHIMHAFGDPEKIFPVAGKETSECALCGKTIYEHDIWSDLVSKHSGSQEENKREYLAFGSIESSIVLCSDCLVQLINAMQIIDKVDPSFLDWTKRPAKSTKCSWNDFKL